MPDDEPAAPSVDRRTFLLLGAAAALAACAPPSTSAPSASARSASASSPSTSSAAGAGGHAPPPAQPAPVAVHQPSGPAQEVASGPRSQAAVALTFHGQGDPALAHRVLDIAREAGAHVTVLAVGVWLAEQAAVARAVLDGGHELGNHTLHHRPMRTMSEATAYAEILGGRRVVERWSAAPHWFRPSGTPHATPALLAAAGRAGYRTSLSFDVDPADYTDPGAAVVARRVLAAARPGSVVSLHLGHAGTAQALPVVLRGLADRGLRADTVSAVLVGVRP